MELSWPKRVELANTPTPIVHVPALSDRLGRRVFIKRDDLTGCAASGNKIRKLEFLLFRAMAEGADVVVTQGALQSNHCRATAVACRQIGLEPHLVLRGEKPRTPQGNYLLDLLLGAHVTFVPERDAGQGMERACGNLVAEYAEAGRRAFVIPVGASNGLGCLGYVRCASEIQDFCIQESIRFSRIYHAAGSGGTTAGLALGAAVYDLGAEVVGINVGEDRVPFLSAIRTMIEDALELASIPIAGAEDAPFAIVEGYAGEGYGALAPDLAAEITRIARDTGILLDPVYTGKAMVGLLDEEARRLEGDNVLFLHTGGLFGLMAQGVDILHRGGGTRRF